MRLPQKYLCPQTKQLMKPHFTAARPIAPNVVWDYKVGWWKYPHSSSTALCWHTVPEQERQLSAKFYRAVCCLMQNMVLIKLLQTLSDFTAPLHKQIKQCVIYLWCSLQVHLRACLSIWLCTGCQEVRWLYMFICIFLFLLPSHSVNT